MKDIHKFLLRVLWILWISVIMCLQYYTFTKGYWSSYDTIIIIAYILIVSFTMLCLKMVNKVDTIKYRSNIPRSIKVRKLGELIGYELFTRCVRLLASLMFCMAIYYDRYNIPTIIGSFVILLGEAVSLFYRMVELQ